MIGGEDGEDGEIDQSDAEIRAEAIEILLVCAWSDEDDGLVIANTVEDLGASASASRLAFDAWWSVFDFVDSRIDQRRDKAEAAALLESGWSPDDPLELLP